MSTLCLRSSFRTSTWPFWLAACIAVCPAHCPFTYKHKNRVRTERFMFRRETTEVDVHLRGWEIGEGGFKRLCVYEWLGVHVSSPIAALQKLSAWILMWTPLGVSRHLLSWQTDHLANLSVLNFKQIIPLKGRRASGQPLAHTHAHMHRVIHSLLFSQWEHCCRLDILSSQTLHSTDFFPWQTTRVYISGL